MSETKTDAEALEWMRNRMLVIEKRSKNWPRWMRYSWSKIDPRKNKKES